jgi:hypothetical protein
MIQLPLESIEYDKQEGQRGEHPAGDYVEWLLATPPRAAEYFTQTFWDTPQKMTVLQKFYLIFVPERHFCGVSLHCAWQCEMV